MKYHTQWLSFAKMINQLSKIKFILTADMPDYCVGNFNLHRDDCPCTGDLQVRPDPKDGALYHVIPANDTKGSVFGPTNFPRRRRGSNLGPLAQEASALTSRRNSWFTETLVYFSEMIWSVFMGGTGAGVE